MRFRAGIVLQKKKKTHEMRARMHTFTFSHGQTNDQPTMTTTSKRDNCVIIFVGQVLIPFGMTLIFNWIAGCLTFRAYKMLSAYTPRLYTPTKLNSEKKCSTTKLRRISKTLAVNVHWLVSFLSFVCPFGFFAARWYKVRKMCENCFKIAYGTFVHRIYAHMHSSPLFVDFN